MINRAENWGEKYTSRGLWWRANGIQKIQMRLQKEFVPIMFFLHFTSSDKKIEPYGQLK